MGTRSRPGELNPAGMLELLKHYHPGHVFIETQQAMPKQGVSSTFQTGYGYGVWIGLITALQIPWTPVRPSTWKRAMLPGLDKADKTSSRIAAIRMFPMLADALRRNSDHGRAEALLIAEYGRQTRERTE